jgi:hypothetical protein
MVARSEVEIEKIAYDTSSEPDRGFTVRASYLKAPHNGDALIEVSRDGKVIREFLYPAYKIWNIAAHFGEIVDGELANHDGGYRAASWNGITDPGAPQPLDQ